MEKPRSLGGKEVKSSTAGSSQSNTGPTFINGRQHKKVASKKGKETFLYQPSSTSQNEHNENMRVTPEMAEFYKKMDTENKVKKRQIHFEIRRPKIQKGHLYKI